jgi:hypothetical protein
LLFALASPRLALVVLWLVTDRLSIVFDNFLLPFLGFLFLPWTTLAWVAAYAPGRGVQGYGWFLVIFAFLVDLSSSGWGAGRGRRARR